MLTLSRNKKLAIYGALTIFVIGFSIYFFKQATNNDIVIPENVSTQPQIKTSTIGNAKINLDFFQTDKFRNLRFDKMPAVMFTVGKRDPFVVPGE